MGVTEKSDCAGKKYPHKRVPHGSMLEVYDKTPIIFPVDISEDVV